MTGPDDQLGSCLLGSTLDVEHLTRIMLRDDHVLLGVVVVSVVVVDVNVVDSHGESYSENGHTTQGMYHIHFGKRL